MSSNMLVGEKRWVSSRRTGMTVLGKVAVPKPLNLPSQRLENHGLDPNAEIVPKGTINWGNRSSLSTVNAWNSSASSPKSDAGSGFSSDVSARPSSGGSGTRPSTAASDRVHDPVPSAWGSNSRPSSASGPLSSNQSSLTSLRPHSAEPRPGSSQLSRFAEPSTDNSVALVPPDISEKLGGLSSTSEGFNLSCGDFPTLGSQKENSVKNTDCRDNGSTSRPRSSSSMTTSVKGEKADASIGDASVNSNVKIQNVDTWRREGSEHFEDVAKHSVEKWQVGDTYAYPNPNMPPQLVDAWRGHPDVWYRGLMGAPHYRPPLGPGGFSLDHIPNYGHHIQTAGLANSRPMAPPNSQPRGHHPGNPDHYRPHTPDAYMHPSMPIRPGFNSSPMSYDGYYRPPMGYSSSNKHDIPFTGTPPCPPVYNRCSAGNSSNPCKEHAKGGCAGNTFSSEHVESGYQNIGQGQCRVLLKQHHEIARKEDNSDWKQTAPMMSTSKVDKISLDQTIDKNERGNGRTSESGRPHRQDTRSWSVGNQKHDPNTFKSNIYFNSSNVKAADFDLGTNSHNSASISQVSSVPSPPKPILIENIERMNFGVNRKSNNYHANDKNREGRDHHPIHSGEVDVPIQRMNPRPTTFNNGGANITRVPGHGMQGKHDHHHGKRFNAQGGDGWQKKPHTVEVATVVSVGNAKLGDAFVHDIQTPEDAVEKPRTNYRGSNADGENSFMEFDISNDERAKMRETAKERAKQLQKEEEERTKELKAKALAKLEALDKRVQPAFGSVQVVETPGSAASVVEQERTKELKEKALEKLEEVKKPVQPAYGLVQKADTPGSTSVVEQEKREERPVASRTDLSTTSILEGISKNEPCDTDSTECKAVPQPSEGNGLFRHKGVSHSYKKKENGATREKMILTEKSSVATAPGKKNGSEGGVADKETTLSSKNVADPPAASNNRRKNNRSNKMKPKLDDDATFKKSAQQVPVEFPENVSKDEHSVGICDPKSGHPVQKDTVTTIEEEEADNRIINHNMKTGRPRPFPKNQQTNRKFEKFRGVSDGVIWAPVRAQNKTEANGKKCDEIPIIGKGGTEDVREGGKNNEKNNNKRAEMKRYVPKPVVAMGGNNTQVTASDEVEEREEDNSQKMVCPDHHQPSQYKQKKTHGCSSRRQRESSSKGEETKTCDAVVDSGKGSPHVDENNPDKKTMTTASQKERGPTSVLKENRGVGASSHWQPKSQQSNSSQKQQETSSGGGKNVVSTQGNGVAIIGGKEDSSSRVEQEVVVVAAVVKKERKIPAPAAIKGGGGRGRRPNQDSRDIVVESSFHDNNNVEDTRSLSGNQNRRNGKSSSYQYHNQYGNNRERQRQNYNNHSRMEYKPVGVQKPNNNNQFEEESGESSIPCNNTRYYREKNQSHSALHY